MFQTTNQNPFTNELNLVNYIEMEWMAHWLWWFKYSRWWFSMSMLNYLRVVGWSLKSVNGMVGQSIKCWTCCDYNPVMISISIIYDYIWLYIELFTISHWWPLDCCLNSSIVRGNISNKKFDQKLFDPVTKHPIHRGQPRWVNNQPLVQLMHSFDFVTW